MSKRAWICTVAMTGLGLLAAVGASGAADPKPAIYTFGSLKAPTLEAARAQSWTWLEATGLKDPQAKAKFEAVWAEPDLPLLDRVLRTVALGDPEAVKILTDARDPALPAPQSAPALLRDPKRSVFERSNLALGYARQLTAKRVYEEALDALRAAVPEQVVDPAAYYFHRAVAEHALVQKKDALNSIARLIDDVADVPERYKMVAILMFSDMQGWKDEDKDLGHIARLMDNIERRLDLSRPGPKTQEIQKKVVFRLDELIKDIENQMKNNGQQTQCPSGGEQPQPGPGSNQPNSPQQDSQIANNSGPGVVDPKKLQNLAQNWGKLQEKERARAMMELTKDLPPRYREVIENYFKTLARSQMP